MIYYKSIFLHLLNFVNGLLILYWGNYSLSIENWIKFSEIQYTIALCTAFCWVGTDVDGIRQVNKERTSNKTRLIASNIIFIRLIIVLLLSPIVFALFELSLGFLIIFFVSANQLFPVFFFYARNELFDTLLKVEVVLKSANIFLLVFVSIFKLHFLYLISAFSFVQFIASLYCLRVANIKLNFGRLFLLQKILKGYRFDSLKFFVMQVNQQVLYSVPLIILSRMGLENSAAEYTNAERITRIIRGVAGNILKVTLGKNDDILSFEYRSLKIFITSFMAVWLLMVSLYIFGFSVYGYLNLVLILLTLVIPIATLNTYTIGTHFKTNKLPNRYLITLIFIIFCSITLNLFMISLGYFITVISLIVIAEFIMLIVLRQNLKSLDISHNL